MNQVEFLTLSEVLPSVQVLFKGAMSAGEHAL